MQNIDIMDFLTEISFLEAAVKGDTHNCHITSRMKSQYTGNNLINWVQKV